MPAPIHFRLLLSEDFWRRVKEFSAKTMTGDWPEKIIAEAVEVALIEGGFADGKKGTTGEVADTAEDASWYIDYGSSWQELFDKGPRACKGKKRHGR